MSTPGDQIQGSEEDLNARILFDADQERRFQYYRKQMAKILRSANVVVVPSIRNGEVFFQEPGIFIDESEIDSSN